MCRYAVCRAKVGEAGCGGGRLGWKVSVSPARGEEAVCVGGGGGDLIRGSACIPLWSPTPYYYLLPRVNWTDKWDQSHLYTHTHTHTYLVC